MDFEARMRGREWFDSLTLLPGGVRRGAAATPCSGLGSGGGRGSGRYGFTQAFIVVVNESDLLFA